MSKEKTLRISEETEVMQSTGVPAQETGDIMARIPSGMRKKENGLFEKRFTVE